MAVTTFDQISVGLYLLRRIRELGCKTVQGLPGDFNLAFLDLIKEVDGLKWSGNCNELNAAYSADGYSRVTNTIGCIVTTFGVGELGAAAGVAGSYCEYVGVVHIVGVPSTTAQKSGALIHHTLGTGDFKVFQDMARPISATQAILDDPSTAASQIDNALRMCYMLAKPVYITLPTNIVYAKISAKPLQTPLDTSWPTNDPATEAEAVREIIEMIHRSKKPIVLADAGAIKFRPGKVIDLMHEFIDKTNFPIFVTPMGKGSVNETNPRYGGVYIGVLSTPAVKQAVEAADLVLHIGGHNADLNTGSFSFAFSTSQTVEFHSDKIKIRYASYPGIAMKPVLRKVIDGLNLSAAREKYPETFAWPRHITVPRSPSTEIEHEWFWPRLETFLRPNDIVITDAGTAFFGLLDVRFPKDVMAINQFMWSAIGYSVGATLGVCLGVRDMHLEYQRRVILIVGDGGLQISVQELSTMVWKNLNPIVFVLNNAGYTVERLIHGPEEEYNDINADWDYTALLKVFGARKSSSFRVTTKDEMDALLSSNRFGTGCEIQLVDVVMPVMDAPRALKEQARLLELANRRAEDDEAPPPKKRKVDTLSSTTNGISLPRLTNGTLTLSA